MSDDVTIEAGKLAWERIRKRSRLEWADWVTIGRALIIGRNEAMKAAQTNQPFGKKYTRTMAAWLAQHGLDGIETQVRWRTLQCMEHLPDIERWLANIDGPGRYRHPDTIWLHYQRHINGPRVVRKFERVHGNSAKATHGGYHARAGKPSQDLIRDVATAIRENWTTDTYKLASVMISAALAHRDELLALLAVKPKPPAKPPSKVLALLEHAEA